MLGWEDHNLDSRVRELIGHGIHQGLSDPDFKIMGGDIYVKRAIYDVANDNIVLLAAA